MTEAQLKIGNRLAENIKLLKDHRDAIVESMTVHAKTRTASNDKNWERLTFRNSKYGYVDNVCNHTQNRIILCEDYFNYDEFLMLYLIRLDKDIEEQQLKFDKLGTNCGIVSERDTYNPGVK